MRTAIAALMLAPAAAAADLDLTPAQRDAFGAEVRALLLEEPEIVGRALAGPDLSALDPYADEIGADLSLIAGQAAALFEAPADRQLGTGPVRLVAFLDMTTAEGRAALDLLETLSQTHPGMAVRQLTAVDLALGGTDTARLARTLGLGLLPSYVTRTALIQGDVPAIALSRAIDRAGTGN